MMLLSVVVIGRNEGTRLERCLASIASMQRVGFEVEVIYVDSSSTDQSLAVAGRAGARTIAITQGRTTAALGRNAGWRSTQGSVILFLDAIRCCIPTSSCGLCLTLRRLKLR